MVYRGPYKIRVVLRVTRSWAIRRPSSCPVGPARRRAAGPTGATVYAVRRATTAGQNRPTLCVRSRLRLPRRSHHLCAIEW